MLFVAKGDARLSFAPCQGFDCVSPGDSRIRLAVKDCCWCNSTQQTTNNKCLLFVGCCCCCCSLFVVIIVVVIKHSLWRTGLDLLCVLFVLFVVVSLLFQLKTNICVNTLKIANYKNKLTPTRNTKDCCAVLVFCF